MKDKAIRVLILTSLFFSIISFYSCDLSYLGFKDNTKGALKITVNPNSSSSSRSVLPATNLTPAEYMISGKGPKDATFQQSTTGTDCNIYNLSVGNWTLTVLAYNEEGTQIGWGESVVSVSPAMLSDVSVSVEPYSGSGSVAFLVNWNNTDVSNPSISASLTDAAGTETNLPFTLGSGSASYSKTDISAGYYTLNIKLIDGGATVSGLVEAVRVLKDFQTTGNFNFTDLNNPTGDVSISVVVNMHEPFEPVINGTAATLAYGTDMTVSASVPDSDGETLIYRWYANGELAGTGESITFGSSLRWGYYRLDLVVTNSDGTRSGSAAAHFTVE